MNAQSGGGFTAIALMMLVVGMGIPMTAALNASLGTHIESPVAASAVLFAVGLIVTSIVLALVGAPPPSVFANAPWWSILWIRLHHQTNVWARSTMRRFLQRAIRTSNGRCRTTNGTQSRSTIRQGRQPTRKASYITAAAPT